MVKDHSVKEETHCCHLMDYFQLAAKDLIYINMLHKLWSNGWNEIMVNDTLHKKHWVSNSHRITRVAV